MAAISALLKMGAQRSPGPAPTYSSSQVILAVLTIGNAGTIGRHSLAEEAGLGEGAVRTVVKWLREEGYIKIEAGGSQLTPKGRQVYSELQSLMPRTLDISQNASSLGKKQVAVLVRRKADFVRSGIEQRDAAIKAGAEGAITYVIRDLKFQVPGSSSDAAKDFPGPAWAEMATALQPEDGDVVIVCGAEDRRTAFIGAISAVLTLLTDGVPSKTLGADAVVRNGLDRAKSVL